VAMDSDGASKREDSRRGGPDSTRDAAGERHIGDVNSSKLRRLSLDHLLPSYYLQIPAESGRDLPNPGPGAMITPVPTAAAPVWRLPGTSFSRQFE